ncbi:hypothetical protein [Sodaliphilus pleomorphus]|uniref:hypothetical protein n=1 Tax=Sodaliphilus pleomorphus TaxID=2606626 RepID=UPI00240A8EF2|nr:hypothetical protein [Sodaliphilus pleomorphus]MDD6686534.1 hypothetical protein [Sodaliphilus pleomorphus]
MTIHHNNEQQRHIEQLLDLFMAGESTLAQEQELARYFATHDVEGDWAVYKQMFAYFDRGMSAQPAPAAQCRKPRLWPWITAAAAALALVLGVTLALVHSKPATAPVTARIEQPHPMPAVTVPASAAAPQRSVAAQAATPGTLARATRPAQPRRRHAAPRRPAPAADPAPQVSQPACMTPEEEMAYCRDAAVEAELQQLNDYDNRCLAQLQHVDNIYETIKEK